MSIYKTSQGRSVPHCHVPGNFPCEDSDLTPAEEENLRRWITRRFPNVQEIGPPTRKSNCHGFAFTHAHGHFEELDLFFEDDFREIEMSESRPGDVLIYRTSDKEIAHSAIVKVVTNGRIGRLISKWGDASVVLHRIREVPRVYGRPAQLFRRRRRVRRRA